MGPGIQGDVAGVGLAAAHNLVSHWLVHIKKLVVTTVIDFAMGVGKNCIEDNVFVYYLEGGVGILALG